MNIYALSFARSALVALAVAGLSTVAAAAVASGDPVQPATPTVTPLETEAGRAALKQASAEKKAAYQLEGAAREDALIAAAASYGVVADTQTHGLLDRAEAAFRAGEILRARGRMDDAMSRFDQATELGETHGDERVGGEAEELRVFAARGLLEAGHLARRTSEVDDALETYAGLEGRFPDCIRQCVQARTWSVKLLVKEERWDDARKRALELDVFLPEHGLEAIQTVRTLVEALQKAERADSASEVVAALQGRLTNHGEIMTEPVASAFGALRDMVGASGY